MRSIIALAFVVTALQGCQTVLADAPRWSYSGTGAARYSDERLSAQATRGIDAFEVTCVNGQLTYRVGEARAISGDCAAEDRLPALDRVRVLSDNQELLLILGPGVGFTNTGAVLLVDEDKPMPLKVISIDTIESFGDVLSRDRIVVRTGALEEGGCLVMYSKELTLNWAMSRVERERTLDRDASGC